MTYILPKLLEFWCSNLYKCKKYLFCRIVEGIKWGHCGKNARQLVYKEKRGKDCWLHKSHSLMKSILEFSRVAIHTIWLLTDHEADRCAGVYLLCRDLWEERWTSGPKLAQCLPSFSDGENLLGVFVKYYEFLALSQTYWIRNSREPGKLCF